VKNVFFIRDKQFASVATKSYGSFSSIGGEYLQSLRSLRCRLFYSAEAEENAQGDKIPRFIMSIKNNDDLKAIIVFMVENRGIEPLTSWLPEIQWQ